MTQKLSVIRGTTNTFQIQLTDADGQPYELYAGETLKFGVKRSKNANSCIIEKILDSDDYTEGAYELKLEPADTEELDFGEYYYDIGMQSGTDYFNVVELSKFEITANITERTVTV